MEVALFIMTAVCCGLSFLVGALLQRDKENKKQSIQIAPKFHEDKYEKQIRNMLSYGGSADGQVELDED